MEKKRKLPARAAARVEQVSKKRTVTPPDNRSVTPAPAPAPPPVVDEPPSLPPPPPLPKSIQPGQPLPVVDDAQPEDLSNKDYQSIQESGVLGDSLQRSRQKWISEGIFEKYWTKPTKRKGVLVEEPSNPPKDSMAKLGAVTVIVEPHIFDATMYAVKDAKPPTPHDPAAPRPIVQYGPPNGTMPPPPLPASTSTPPTPLPSGVQSPRPTTATGPSQAQQEPPRPPPAASAHLGDATTSDKRPVESAAPPVGNPQQPTPSPAGAASAPPPPSFPSRPPPPPTATPGTPPVNGAAQPPPAGGARPAIAGTDPIIVMLAEKATEDPNLRDLMKRVAQGQAPLEELERFQAIIDQITAETKRKGSVQGPSADRLLVDRRTVRYFADEVRAILDIVLTTNPRQTSADLRPPAKSDPLVVELVKAALDETKTREIVRRIAGNKPQFADATDLKLILDRLHQRVIKEQEAQQKTTAVSGSAAKTNGTQNGSGSGSGSSSSTPTPPQPAPQQALRSKGPPPPLKQDISAVVFEFAGGTGDRYLFPKFSILEFIPGPNGQQQLLASFLIVRKGSVSEYGGDPSLDYYQPVTIRLQSPSQRLLENLTRVAAPVDEVKRYMNDVMDNMTRAEYVLIAMRLPRPEEKEPEEKDTGPPKPLELEFVQVHPHEAMVWSTKATGPPPNVAAAKAPTKPVGEDEQYQMFISTVTPMEVDDG